MCEPSAAQTSRSRLNDWTFQTQGPHCPLARMRQDFNPALATTIRPLLAIATRCLKTSCTTPCSKWRAKLEMRFLQSASSIAPAGLSARPRFGIANSLRPVNSPSVACLEASPVRRHRTDGKAPRRRGGPRRACGLDKFEEPLAPRRDMSTVLDIGGRPETLRPGHLCIPPRASNRHRQ
jgi:hypothetical protein